MSTRDFPVDLNFLNSIAAAAGGMIVAEPERKTVIGSGPLTLADRLIARKEDGGNIYIHYWRRSDPDDLHDHPWDFASLILRTGYWEISPEGRVWRAPGSIAFHRATDRHRVELDAGKRGTPVSMILTGPVVREWGFHTGTGFVAGRDYRSTEAFQKRGDAKSRSAA